MKRKFFTITTIFFIFLSSILAENKKEIYAETYLSMGVFKELLPAFSNEKDKGTEDFIKFQNFDITTWQPEEGGKIKFGKKFFEWKKSSTDDNFLVFKPSGSDKHYQKYYAALYLENSEWTKIKLNVQSNQMFEVFLDGNFIGEKTKVEQKKNGEDKFNKISKQVELERGKHLIIIKSLYKPNSKNNWKLKTFVQEDSTLQGVCKFTTNPFRHLKISDLMDDTKIRRVTISSDGIVTALELSKRNVEAKTTETWLALYTTETGELIETFRGGSDIRNIKWAPEGQIFAYVTYDKGKQNLWVNNLTEGKVTLLLGNQENLSYFVWSPTGEYILYGCTQKAKESKSSLIKYNKLSDRVPGSNSKSFIYKVTYPDAYKSIITAGKEGTSLNSISHDGRKIVFTKSRPSLERPFGKTSFYILDMETMEIDSLFTGGYASSAKWSPDDKKLLITGGPSLFGKIGLDLPEGVIPNDYDTQAYIYDIKTKNVDPITKDFDPKISYGIWKKDKIYFSVADKSFSRLYIYNVNNKTYKQIELGIEHLSSFDISDDASFIVFTGSSSNVYNKCYLYRTKENRVEEFVDPLKDEFSKIRLSKVENFNFTNDEGTEIMGRVYYPVDYDADKKYPAIVYYYGGVSPVTRNFGGGYPKNLWAANGYFVYILQPSGACGFGQKFSAKHVNDWGKITAQDIIKGTKLMAEKFLAVDEKHIGCIGASYGGFMTMNLITKTDIFAAAISHAGISAISSYWGEGYWGYQYSAVASANSYPWNNKKLYTEHSPLFNADKIKTPLLLLHGNVDTNVPPGESIQMFVALKLLNKDVSFIQIDKQNHHIVDYEKKIEWTKAIIAYFDKYLKNQSKWWENNFSK